MRIVKIMNTILNYKKQIIQPNEQMVDHNGNLLFSEYEDENNNIVNIPVLNNSESNEEIIIIKTEEEINQEKQELINLKTIEIQQKINAYEQQKQNQLINGGVGAVAEFIIMDICNHHNKQFLIEII